MYLTLWDAPHKSNSYSNASRKNSRYNFSKVNLLMEILYNMTI